MHRTNSLVGALAAVVTVSGASLNAAATPVPAGAPPAVCTGVPEELTLIVNSGDGVGAVTASAYVPIVDSLGAPAVSAVRGPDGTVWVARGGDRPAILRAGADAAPGEVYAAAEIELASAGWLGGRSAAVFLDTTGVPEPTGEGIGAVVVDFADGAQLTVSPSVWWEAGVNSASIGADRVIEGGGELVDDWFRSFGSDGSEHTDWISPNNGDERPSYIAPIAAVSPDGAHAELSYLERGIQGSDGLWSDRHVLVVADAVTGAPSLRLDVGQDGSWPVQADFDGRFWVGTFGAMSDVDPTDPVAERVVVVDTGADAPVAVDAGCAAGTTASIDKTGSAEPNLPEQAPSTTAAATTTAPGSTVPPTTTPGQCDEYTTADHGYPIQRCEQGAPVAVVQLMLVHRGIDVDQDGYFGPATESAVREFQLGAGVAADGLVGPDTWAALYDPARLPGADNDGNGTVDPWEVTPGPGEGDADAEPADYVGLVWDSAPPDFVVTDTGTGRAVGARSTHGWVIDCCGTPLYTGDLMVDGSQTMLWLNRSDGNNPDGTTKPWTVLASIGVEIADAQWFSSLCSIDGAPTDGVVAVVRPTAGSDYPASAAWMLDPATATISELDPVRVTCQIEGD